MAIRILIVDDSATFRERLRTILEAHVDWEVCGEGVDGIEGVDLSMPRMTGIQAAYEILKEFPTVPILLLTLSPRSHLVQEARNIGIRGTLSKAAMDHLVGGIDRVLHGEEFPAPVS
jgi:DNA-binding NarL/FixJ family response regulator